MSTTWLPTLITPDPEAGYALAVTLARTAVKLTQPDAEIRAELRSVYDHDPNALIRASAVVALHFQTVAAANGYWRPASQSRDLPAEVY